MARALSTSLADAYQGYVYDHARSYYNGSGMHNTNSRLFEVRVDKPVFEVPIFLLNTLMDSIRDGTFWDLESIVTELYTEEKVTQYKTIDRYMTDVLIQPYFSQHLIQLNAKSGNTTVIYYGAAGCVFKQDFTPIMTMSWVVEKVNEDNPETRHIKFVRPVLHLSPTSYICQYDAMEKYLSRKLLNELLTMTFRSPGGNCRTRLEPTVEIGKFPFSLIDTSYPSISTDNQELLQLAIDHIDDMR